MTFDPLKKMCMLLLRCHAIAFDQDVKTNYVISVVIVIKFIKEKGGVFQILADGSNGRSLMLGYPNALFLFLD